MGRIRRTKPAGTTRREFMRRAGGTAAALGAVRLLQACGGGDDDDTDTSNGGAFHHGVASGDLLANRVILWTRITPSTAGPVAVECVVATDPAVSQIVARVNVTTDAGRDYTVKIDVAGLQQTPLTTTGLRRGAHSRRSAEPARCPRELPRGCELPW